jgi:hypothetical protein
MTLLFGFAPFFLFTLLSRLSADLALWLAFTASFVITIRDFVESPSLRLLDGVSLTLFGLLALVRGFFLPELSLAVVRTIVDGVLCLALLVCLLGGRPFSLEYAAPQSHHHWPLPDFLRVNQLISLVWVLGFAMMTLADAAVAFLPLPFYVGVAASVVVLATAVTFTLLYPTLAVQRLPR